MTRNTSPKEFAVVGAGRLGSSLARRLEELGHEVLVMDKNRARIQEIAADVTNAVVLDATVTEALEAVDIRSFGTVVVAIAEDFEAAVLTVATLKELGIRRVWSQARTATHQEILQRVGADRVVRPLEESGERMADELANPGLEDRLTLAGGVDLIRVAVPAWLVGKSVADAPTDAPVFLIVRNGRVLTAPFTDLRFDANDAVVVMADARQLTRLARQE